VQQANPAGFSPLTHHVIEIESGYIAELALSNPTAANVGRDPHALDKAAKLLATLPAFLTPEAARVYVVLYDYAAAGSADAWLYAAIATQNDGLDFAENALADTRDTDTLELIAIFKGVGVNAFTSSNFV